MEDGATSAAEVPKIVKSPLSATALARLFFAPTKYFQSASLDQGHAWLLASWVSGISSVIDRIDQRLLRSEIGSGSVSGMGRFVDSWPAFWGLLLTFGILWAAWNWWIGGWWYRIRINWSGAANADPRQARLVYTFSSMVVTLPAVVYAGIQTAMYPSYLAAWQSDSAFGFSILIFLFWSVIVSWRGVLAVFNVRRARALFWFAALPTCVYLVLFGVLGALLSEADGR